ncbi:MAG: NHLP family bacteriocin export ABC transporter permease/ATPase subunit [Candidatus Improbicoccus devescovinae]|nr:MAG: NHLP family bacteriocin export ABC transporter permease/ATPase subunit [Candidatus Improbicoccus devescovinae]
MHLDTEDQIEIRKIYDDKMYAEAFNDFLSILGIKIPVAVQEVKGAVGMILKFLGKPIPKIPSNITDPDEQLQYLLKPSGTMKRRVELLGNWWKDCSGCLLASTKNNEIIAILPNSWGKYYYIDKLGNTININKKTAKGINLEAFCFYKSFPLNSLKIKDLLIFMAKTVTKNDIFFIILIYIIMQSLGMLSPYITKIIYDKLIPSEQLGLILPIISMMIGITISTSLIGITKSLILAKIQGKLNVEVNSAIMMRMFSLPASFFKNYSSGELSSRVGYLASLCQSISDIVLSTSLSALFSLVYIFQMNQFAPALVLPGMIAIFISILFTTIVTLARQKINITRMDLSPKFQSLVFSLFGGIQKIKIAGAEKRAFSKWAKSYSEIQKLEFSPPLFLKISDLIITVINTLGTIALYYSAVTNKIPTSSYLAFIGAYGAVSSAIMAISGIALQISNLKPVFDLIKPFIKECPENSSGGKLIASLSGKIEINNITFRYTNNSPYILKNLSFSIKKGEYIAIVGTTGCGKSTLLRILLGFEKPETGAVYYGGNDISSLDLGTLRQKIGVVIQNGTIFAGDIFSNIIVTAPWKNMDDAWEAAKLASLDADIKAMPMGMHTLIAEGAGGISGGQKQRLMIARAIIARPSILFLDEATSALDNITQSYIAKSLANLKCTRLVIAHRLSTVKNCDRILVLDKGTIIESGNYETLMSKKGMFYELAIRQVVDPEKIEKIKETKN